MKRDNNEMLRGTLDMMVLRTLVTGDAHGHTIAKVIERSSEDVLEVEQGSLYPALHRLEDRGWVSIGTPVRITAKPNFID
jgi:PadR family transcriptional regulator, regulatory protein PadR